jgi:pyridoxamine 5'-phosphate oxidase
MVTTDAPGPVDPARLRRDYVLAELDESTIAGDWLAQLLSWFQAAVDDLGVLEANALQVATVGADGRPSLRTVLAKGIDERGVSFYTNYGSAKARELDGSGYAAAQFLWQAQERQVRLTGSVTRVPRAETEQYFATRPRGSQLGAWASPQSQPIASRAELQHRLVEVEQRFGDGPVPAPPHWGGYLLAPDSVEFWQGRASRLHDRLRFRLVDGDWTLERLAP